MNNWYITPSDNDLLHYGVLGMKWGVRRYQNADGSYTREGLKRYNASRSRYEKAKENYKANKTSTNAAMVKASKKQLKADYKQLEKDYKADKGKNLYAQGKTVSDINSSARAKASGFLISSGLVAAGWAFKSIPKNMPLTVLVNHPQYGQVYKRVTVNGTPISLQSLVIASGLATAAIGTLINAKNQKEIKELRAYYGHSRTPLDKKLDGVMDEQQNKK